MWEPTLATDAKKSVGHWYMKQVNSLLRNMVSII